MRRGAWGGALALVVAVLASLAGCAGSSSSGLIGDQAARDLAGEAVTVGQIADYTAFVVNHTGHAATLESARLVSLAGFPAPRQAPGLAIEAGRLIAFSATGWPPAGGDFGLRPFRGYVVPPGARAQILYSVFSDVPGDFVAKGIEVTTRVAGATRTVLSLSGALTCVYRVRPRPCPDAYINRVQAVVSKEQ